MARDWTAAGTLVRERRVRLGFKTAKEFAAKVGVSVETIGNIENGRKTAYSLGVQAAVEDALNWVQGSFMAVADGKEPRTKPDPLFDRIRAVWPKLDQQSRHMVVEIVEAALRKH